MKNGQNLPGGVLVALMLMQGTLAHVIANPYEAIVGRNVFGLKPTPLNPPPGPPPPAATTIKLLGISTILDRRQVMLKVKTAARPPEPAKEQSYLMSQGQREDEIEVLEIDAAAGTVKIKNQDETLSLSMKDDAEKPAAGAVLPGAAVPPPPGMVPPNPGQPAPGGGSRTIPTRSVRSSPSAAAMPALPSQPQSPPPALSAVEQSALMELEREHTKDLVKQGKYPPLPPLPGGLSK